MPVAAVKLQLSDHDWAYKTVPQKFSHFLTNGNISHWPRGRVLGGCSTINYMLAVRGNPADWDQIADATGKDHWKFNTMLSYFKKLETSHSSIAEDKEYRGRDGPMHIQKLPHVNSTTSAFIKGAMQCGLEYNDDFNGKNQLGVSATQATHFKSRRWATSSGYLVNAQHRSNLHIATYAQASKVIFDSQKRAVGVEFKQGVKKQSDMRNEKLPIKIAKAKREVILSAGAVGSPHLLMLSGIGERQQLEQHGINCLVDLPAVGQNVEDHLFAPLSFQANISTLSPKDETLGNLIKWFRGEGAWTSSTIEAMAFYRAANQPEGDKRPYTQFHFAAAGWNADLAKAFNTRIDQAAFQDKALHGTYQFAILPTLLHPRSKGSIRLATASPADHPLIDPNYLADPRDVEVMVEGMKLAEKIANTPEMRAVRGKLIWEDMMVVKNPFNKQTDETKYWEFLVRHLATTVYHPTSSCRMGKAGAKDCVVDPYCKVTGVTGLRVIDASVFPNVTSGNTNLPTVALAERAADLIKDEYNLHANTAVGNSQRATASKL